MSNTRSAILDIYGVFGTKNSFGIRFIRKSKVIDDRIVHGADLEKALSDLCKIAMATHKITHWRIEGSKALHKMPVNYDQYQKVWQKRMKAQIGHQ